MGNCLRGPRNVLDPILMADDSSPGELRAKS